MVVPRRWVLSLIAGIAILGFLYQIYQYPISGTVPIQTQPYTSPFQNQDGHFKWRHRPQHFPPTRLTLLPTGKPEVLPKVQHVFATESPSQRQSRLLKRDQVKQEFIRCWNSYKDRAWMKDELSPISGRGRNFFGGWSATLVDALDTLWIMDLKDDFREAADASDHIDFAKSTDDIVNIFETTIRYLGGFLAAYDLSGNKTLLDNAVRVGDMLLVAFDTPNHFPITRWEWQKAASGEPQETPSGMLVSELGSLSLEFTRLSQLTQDNRWYDAIDRIMNLFSNQQEKTKLPGLWPIVVNPKEKDMTSDTGFTFGGMSDSLYEYLPKEHALLGGQSPIYRKMYERSIEVAIEALFFRPMTPDGENFLISGDARASDDGSTYVTEPKAQHLGCFAGGMLALGGKLFLNDHHVTLAKRLTDGCIWAYKSMSRGIMPEIAHFVSCESKTSCAWDESKWIAAVLEQEGPEAVNTTAEEIIGRKNLPKGYSNVDDSRYILRPEAIESVFILYRITGEEKYRDAAWEMFNAIRNVTRTDFANAGISDITVPPTKGDPPKQDRMESFWLAETLKYFYLIFSEPELLSLDEYVLNTEAHPLRRPK